MAPWPGRRSVVLIRSSRPVNPAMVRRHGSQQLVRRARVTMRDITPPQSVSGSLQEQDREIMDRFMCAWHRYDFDILAAMLREDAILRYAVASSPMLPLGFHAPLRFTQPDDAAERRRRVLQVGRADIPEHTRGRPVHHDLDDRQLEPDQLAAGTAGRVRPGGGQPSRHRSDTGSTYGDSVPGTEQPGDDRRRLNDRPSRDGELRGKRHEMAFRAGPAVERRTRRRAGGCSRRQVRRSSGVAPRQRRACSRAA